MQNLWSKVTILNVVLFSTCTADIKNTPKAKGVLVKFNHEKKKEYSAEIMAKINNQKKKVTVYPKVLIKTPVKELASLRGSLVGVPETSLRVDLTLDKVFRVPATLKGSDYLIWKFLCRFIDANFFFFWHPYFAIN